MNERDAELRQLIPLLSKTIQDVGRGMVVVAKMNFETITAVDHLRVAIAHLVLGDSEETLAALKRSKDALEKATDLIPDIERVDVSEGGR